MITFLFYSNYGKFNFLYAGSSHASTLKCPYDCLLGDMFLFYRNNVILTVILIYLILSNKLPDGKKP